MVKVGKAKRDELRFGGLDFWGDECGLRVGSWWPRVRVRVVGNTLSVDNLRDRGEEVFPRIICEEVYPIPTAWFSPPAVVIAALSCFMPPAAPTCPRLLAAFPLSPIRSINYWDILGCSSSL